MTWSSFRRVCRFGEPSGLRRLSHALGSLSALPSVLLIFNVGVLVDVVLNASGGAKQLPESVRSVLGPGISEWLGRQQGDRLLLVLLGGLVVLALLEALLVWLHARAVARISVETASRLERALYEQLSRSPGEGLLCTRTCNLGQLQDDVDHVRGALLIWWRTMPRSSSLLVLLILLGLIIDPSLTLLAVLLAVFVWRWYQQARHRGEQRARQFEQQAAQRREILVETFRAARIVSAVSTAGNQTKSFLAALERYRADALRALTSTDGLRPLLYLSLAFSVALMLLVVGLSPRSTSLWMIVLALTYSRLFLPTFRLRRALDVAQEADRAASRIFDILDEKPRIEQRTGAEEMPRLSRHLRWENVTYDSSDDGAPLSDISLMLPANSMAAWLSTDPRLTHSLVQICLRHSDPDAGCIWLDDRDLRSFTLNSLRVRTGFVGSRGDLFPGTIFDNIHCGRGMCLKEDVEQAAELCGILDPIHNLPMGFHTTIGRMARDLPPSLAFRIGVARAIVSDPSLLLIEEPRSFPDESSADSYEQLLSSLRQNRTLIVLATRLATLRAADEIFVFHDGRLHAHGEHPKLLQEDALYRHLNYLLFNPFRSTVSLPSGNAANGRP